MPQRVEHLLQVDGKPLTANRVKHESLVRLQGAPDVLKLARQTREVFLDQLNDLAIDPRHSKWFAEWLNSLCSNSSAKFWLTLGTSTMLAAWDAHVAERHRMASAPKPTPLPKKEVHLPANPRLSISKRYHPPTWV